MIKELNSSLSLSDKVDTSPASIKDSPAISSAKVVILLHSLTLRPKSPLVVDPSPQLMKIDCPPSSLASLGPASPGSEI